MSHVVYFCYCAYWLNIQTEKSADDHIVTYSWNSNLFQDKKKINESSVACTIINFFQKFHQNLFITFQVI